MFPFFMLILALAPWKPEYHQALFDMRVIVHECPCPAAAWAVLDHAEIHLCPSPGHQWEWMGLHESQHIMAAKYLPGANFDIFSHVAMKALRTGGYTDDQIWQAEFQESLGGHELHAELPWITHGEIPANLQRWYPWFDLSRVGAPEEDATWPVGQ